MLHAAFVLRRPTNPLAAVTASALAVVVIAPLQVFSASFLMSYGIVFALLVLGLPLAEAWQARWTPWRDLPEATWSMWHRSVAWAWRWAAPALAIGLATTLVGLITGVQFFRLLTPGALAANLVLIPAAAGVTVLGFISLVTGLLGLGIGAVLCNHLAAWLLLAIEQLVRWSVLVPGMFVPARFTAAWVGPVTLAALLIALGFGYAVDWKAKRGGWWPPFAIVAVALIFGVEFG